MRSESLQQRVFRWQTAWEAVQIFLVVHGALNLFDRVPVRVSAGVAAAVLVLALGWSVLASRRQVPAEPPR